MHLIGQSLAKTTRVLVVLFRWFEVSNANESVVICIRSNRSKVR